MESQELHGAGAGVVGERVKHGPEAEVVLGQRLPFRQRDHAERPARRRVQIRGTRQDLPQVVALAIINPEEVEDRVARLEAQDIHVAVGVDGDAPAHRLVEVVRAVGDGSSEGAAHPRAEADLERSATGGLSQVVPSVPLETLDQAGLERLGRRILPSEKARDEVTHDPALSVDDRHFDVRRFRHGEVDRALGRILRQQGQQRQNRNAHRSLLSISRGRRTPGRASSAACCRRRRRSRSPAPRRSPSPPSWEPHR